MVNSAETQRGWFTSNCRLELQRMGSRLAFTIMLRHAQHGEEVPARGAHAQQCAVDVKQCLIVVGGGCFLPPASNDINPYRHAVRVIARCRTDLTANTIVVVSRWLAVDRDIARSCPPFHSRSGKVRIHRFFQVIHGTGQWTPDELVPAAAEIAERELRGRDNLKIARLELPCRRLIYAWNFLLLIAVGKVPP